MPRRHGVRRLGHRPLPTARTSPSHHPGPARGAAARPPALRAYSNAFAACGGRYRTAATFRRHAHRGHIHPHRFGSRAEGVRAPGSFPRASGRGRHGPARRRDPHHRVDRPVASLHAAPPRANARGTLRRHVDRHHRFPRRRRGGARRVRGARMGPFPDARTQARGARGARRLVGDFDGAGHDAVGLARGRDNSPGPTVRSEA